MGKDLIYQALRHENTKRVPWVPFAGVHSGKLKGYTGLDVLRDEDKLVEALLEVNKLYEPDGMPVMEFILGSNQTALKDKECVRGFSIPRVEGRKSCFVKLGNRRQVATAQISAALVVDLGSDRRIISTRLFFGALAPRPLRLTDAEAPLRGLPLEECSGFEVCRQVAAPYSDYIARHTPVEFDRDYKLKAIYGVVEDLLEQIKT